MENLLPRKWYYVLKRLLFYKSFSIAFAHNRTQRNRAYVLKKANYKCVNCGTKENLTIDHIHPLSKGGKRTALSNMQCLCEICNKKKGDKLLSNNLIPSKDM